jgi:hypothetical protein
MTANREMSVSGRRRWQAPLQFNRTGHHLLPQSRRQSSPHTQLAFQAGRQTISLGQPRRQTIALITIPAPHFVTIVIAVVLPTLIIVTVAVSFAFAMAVTMLVVERRP